MRSAIVRMLCPLLLLPGLAATAQQPDALDARVQRVMERLEFTSGNDKKLSIVIVPGYPQAISPLTPIKR